MLWSRNQGNAPHIVAHLPAKRSSRFRSFHSSWALRSIAMTRGIPLPFRYELELFLLRHPIHSDLRWCAVSFCPHYQHIEITFRMCRTFASSCKLTHHQLQPKRNDWSVALFIALFMLGRSVAWQRVKTENSLHCVSSVRVSQIGAAAIAEWVKKEKPHARREFERTVWHK